MSGQIYENFFGYITLFDIHYFYTFIYFAATAYGSFIIEDWFLCLKKKQGLIQLEYVFDCYTVFLWEYRGPG